MTQPNYATFYDPPILPTSYVQSYRHQRRASAPPVRAAQAPEDHFTRLPPPPPRGSRTVAGVVLPPLERINSVPGTDAERAETEGLIALRQRLARLEAMQPGRKTICAMVTATVATIVLCVVAPIMAIRSGQNAQT